MNEPLDQNDMWKPDGGERERMREKLVMRSEEQIEE